MLRESPTVSVDRPPAAPAAPAPIRTLFVTLDPPWPPVSGAELRNWQNAVAAHAGGPVAIASVTAGSNAASADGIAFYALSNRASGTLWRGSPAVAEADLILPPEAASGLARAIADFAPTTIVIEHPAIPKLLPAKRPAGIRVICDMHNVESAMAARSARAHFPLRLRRWLADRSAERTAALAERRIAADADTVWVCSRDEAMRLRRVAGNVPVHVVPNGIPRPAGAPGALPPPRPGKGRPFTLVFVGHLAYPPNAAAMRWLARGILPLVRRHLGARLVLAGRSPDRAAYALADDPGVTVLGDPDSIDSVLADADLAVLPIRAGGGTRIKALEAMSRGLPVVATRFAVDGLDLGDGVHYRAAETTRAFARAILALAADPAAYAQLRAAAWRHCVRNFGPSAIVRAVCTGLAAP